jgi:hypothetical protein
VDAIRLWTDFKSLAHWLSWACSMSPGVAREHVRVAKALRGMPTIAGLFREGRLSYSKVREVTRVVDVVDEQRLAGLALTATASQLARMISGFRSADGMRISQQTQRKVNWHEREDGMIEFRARLPKDEAALVIAAIRTAKDQFGRPPAKSDPCGMPSRRGYRALVSTAMSMACWMWPAASSTRLRRIVPVRTALWWWCRSRWRTWPETFPQERLRQLSLVGASPRKRLRHRSVMGTFSR